MQNSLKIMVVLGQYPARELQRRRRAVSQAAGPGVEVGFGTISGNVYRAGLTNLDRARVGPLVAEKAVEAEKDGFDAVVPYGTLDLGVEEARHLTSIPVVGPGRAACTIATGVCERFVILCYDEPHAVMFDRLVRQWRVDQWVTSIRSVDIPITSMLDRPDELRRRFVDRARRAADEERAEVIVPLGMTMVPVSLSATALTDEVGIPVIDPLAAGLGVAQTLASSGFSNSRKAYPAAQL